MDNLVAYLKARRLGYEITNHQLNPALKQRGWGEVGFRICCQIESLRETQSLHQGFFQKETLHQLSTYVNSFVCHFCHKVKHLAQIGSCFMTSKWQVNSFQFLCHFCRGNLRGFPLCSHDFEAKAIEARIFPWNFKKSTLKGSL